MLAGGAFAAPSKQMMHGPGRAGYSDMDCAMEYLDANAKTTFEFNVGFFRKTGETLIRQG